jgi:hypothetical protein
VGPAGDNPRVPAAYTYLGQFVDHDLTFDVTKVALGESISPAQLLQGRSPTLDLDSVYGSGPDDEKSRRFYQDDRIHLKVGTTSRIGSLSARKGFDVPRVGTSSAPRRAWARRWSARPCHRMPRVSPSHSLSKICPQGRTP